MADEDKEPTVEELKDALRAKALPVSGTKAELLERLESEGDEEEAPAEEVTSDTAADAIDKIEEAVNTLADNWTDTGDGAMPHIKNLQKSVEGLRHSQRAWAYQTVPGHGQGAE